ncbi:hypothetical protein ABB37_02273 [Leptomonas pyrrhocoris]|uniref:Uncharacterized protein n=1 Tax=Leptomonas pyrrhocoris TaxID=157538 RepID=A0A0N0VGX3_LEPPY|nr:hypothetical protein ABB37_02273 [Leptomonas pyrrhocoris]KPA84221.1 hypothetical protein ABB37_02273 [Leptomonas pyrrhocoris]|eukprot:XP_015662660.1 hypothetical protein ABB37_02273 [Leptomonas pyrrhocoris]
MTSLVPFDFRCVGQLTGISLRCAPLHICLPFEWPSASSDTTEKHSTLAQETTASVLASIGDATPPSPRTGNPGAVDIPELVETNATCTSSSATPLPPPEAERALAPSMQAASPTHSPAVAKSTSATAPTASSSSCGTRMPGSAPRVIGLHNPALCMETFFELFPADELANGDDARSFSDLSWKEKPADRNGGHSAVKADGEGASEAPVYTSEVVRGSSYPNWSSIPIAALQPYAHSTHIELSFFYTGSCISHACALDEGRPETDPPQMATESVTAAPCRAISIGDEVEPVKHGAASSAPSDVCVHRCRVDVRQTFYLGATMEEADVTLSRLLRLEQQRAQGPRHLPRPLIYLRCSDGVFVPTSCFADWQAPVASTFNEWQATRTHTFCPAPAAADFHGSSPTPSSLNTIAGRNSLAALAAAQAAAACVELPWSRAPSSIGWRYPAFAVPRVGQPRATMGDVKAAAYGTLAWGRLASVAEQRKTALANQLDAEATAHPTERAVAARCAAVRVQLSAAREALTLSTLELESLRERVGQRQQRLQREEETLAAVQQYESILTSPESVKVQREQVRIEEAQRAQLRAQLARVRQRRVRELCLVYTVTLSSHYAYHACANAADAKDHINTASLPILFAGRADADAASHLVASTADAMHEEAVGLGHACHLLIVLSILYSCTLPYPILLGIGQSHVLASPSVDAAQALDAPYTLTEARKYPLSCRKVAERPLMMAGVHLLLRDAAVLAKTMGKPERRIASCSDRLGALLHLLLYDAE